MSTISWTLLTAFVVTAFSLRVLVPISHKIRLLDVPAGRKVHDKPTPLVGGIATYCGVLFTLFLAAPLTNQSLYFLLGGTIVLVIGLVDDIKPLGVRIRLVFQSLAIGLVIWGTDLHITQIPSLVGDGKFDLGVFGIPFTIIAVIGLMNAFNLVDGIDGLAGSLAIVAILGIFSFASLRDASQDHTLVLLLGVAILPYLLHNLGLLGEKVFLGDAGSMFIGFILAWTLIDQSEAHQGAIGSISVLWCVALPVIDTLGVMVRRIRKGNSPFQPDRDHLHHILQRVGLSSRMSLVVLVGTALVILAAGLVIELVVPQIALLLFCLLFGAYTYALLHAWKLQKLMKG